jgi:hypothetical protein
LSLLSCGESSRRNPLQGGAAGTAGASGSGASGQSGASGSGGAIGPGATGGSAGTSSELTRYFQPGSRLKPKVLGLGNGADVIEGSPQGSQWYDANLEFDCLFVPDEDGTERCFPLQLLVGNVYTDASCERLAAVASNLNRCENQRFDYLVADLGVCAYRGFRVGAELPPSTPLFVRSPDGTSCMAHSGANELGLVYALEPVPADTFVAMSRTARPRAPGLDAYVREGTDGSWEVIGYFDAARESSCFPAPGDWTSRCLPSFAGSTRWFADSSCERPTVEAWLRTCQAEQPTCIISVRADSSTCPITVNFEVLEIEGIRETTPHAVDDSGACVASSLEAAEYYVPGERIDVSTLPELEAVVLGTGKLRARFSGFGGIPYLPDLSQAGVLIDESGNVCMPYGAPDGTVRCFPASFSSAARSALRYEDSSCSGAPVVPWVGRPACPADAPLPAGVMFPDEASFECSPGLAFSEIIAVVGESTASTLYSKDEATGACESAGPPTPTLTYLRLGEPLASDAFPEVERAIRQ